jgi:hypothetical protein
LFPFGKMFFHARPSFTGFNEWMNEWKKTHESYFF